MKLSEKILFLRKNNGYSQESLAELCHVSRQCISKWEADIALPSVDTLILLSKLFQVSLDVLIKDELILDSIIDTPTCGSISTPCEIASLFEGILIKESLETDSILDYLSINKVEVWKTSSIPKYWTAIYFTSSIREFPDLISKVMLSKENGDTNWFVDFKSGNIKYIVFRNKILTYTIGNHSEKLNACEECRKMGIPNEQMKWSE